MWERGCDARRGEREDEHDDEGWRGGGGINGGEQRMSWSSVLQNGLQLCSRLYQQEGFKFIMSSQWRRCSMRGGRAGGWVKGVGGEVKDAEFVGQVVQLSDLLQHFSLLLYSNLGCKYEGWDMLRQFHTRNLNILHKICFLA